MCYSFLLSVFRGLLRVPDSHVSPLGLLSFGQCALSSSDVVVVISSYSILVCPVWGFSLRSLFVSNDRQKGLDEEEVGRNWEE